MQLKSTYLLVVLALLFATNTVAQKRTKRQVLEARRTQLQKDVVYISALLSNNKRKEKNLLGDVKDLNHKIQKRATLISVISKESKALENEIYLNQLAINKYQHALKVLKKDYAKMIFKSYKSKNQNNRIMFLLSSKNFFQAYKRFQYMKQYTQFRKKQAEEIQQQKENLK